MPGVAGEWFRPSADRGGLGAGEPVHQLHARPDAVGLLGATRRGTRAPKRGISRLAAGFNRWFDHQADRYGNVIAWALHHRRWMALFAVASLGRRAHAAGEVRRLGAFLPASDYGTIAIDVRTPSSASLEYTRLKVEAAATLAHHAAETRPPTATSTRAAGRLRRPGQERRRANARRSRSPPLRGLWRAWWAPSTVLDDLNMGAEAGADPLQRPGFAQAAGDQQPVHGEDAPGAGRGTWAFRTGAAGRAEDRAQPRAGEHAGHLGQRRRQALRVAFAGVEVGDWIDPAARRATWRCGWPGRPRGRRQHRAAADRREPAATAWCRWARSPPSPWARAFADPARGRQAHDFRGGANAQGRSPAR